MTDGAAAVLVVSEAVLERDRRPSRSARFVAFAVRGRAARAHGHRPGRGHPGGAASGPA